MHIDFVNENTSQSAKSEIPKCQIDTLECTLEEMAVLDLIKKNPSVKQTELAESARNRKGLSVIGTKSKNAKLVHVGTLSTKVNYVVESLSDKLIFTAINSIPLDTRTGSGKVVCKEKIKNVYPFIDSQK